MLDGVVNNNGHDLLFSGPGNAQISPNGTIQGSGGLQVGPDHLGGTLSINAATTFQGNTRIARAR